MMDARKHFEKHFAKLKKEAIVRSLVAALIVGFGAGFVAAIVTWIIEMHGLWIPAVAIVLATGISMPIFYNKKYCPTAMRSARRIDRLGLEERLVTMVEYEADESYVAQIQRQDAQQKLNELNEATLKIKVDKRPMIAMVITGVFGIGMYVVAALAALGLLPTGLELWEDLSPEEPIKYISVTYDVEEGGYIEGESDQLIPIGGNTSEIVAVADDGFEFVGWDDGHTKPGRSDGKIMEDVVYIAIFASMEQESQDGDPSQEAQDQPQDQPQEQENQQSQQQQDQESQQPSNNGGGKYEEANQIIDGETYYKEVLDTYREILQERLEQEGDQMTDEERAIIEAYLGIV